MGFWRGLVYCRTPGFAKSGTESYSDCYILHGISICHRQFVCLAAPGTISDFIHFHYRLETVDRF